MTKDKFLRGAMILTLAGLMVKIIGSVNRILLSRLLGGEGIGLYQMAYPVYLLMLSVSSAGNPIANSNIETEKVAKGDCLIYSVRKNEKMDEPLATIELCDKRIVQVRAAHNEVPNEEISNFVRKWESKFRLSGW